ncbi:BTB/POZ domain-containing protein 10 [Elsinoe australis]|uniref:BTB/POZ domain-containing protein 10 n=1 Tax=Elsinoe australis TaxID=40998 RepID=A0A4U7B5K6_9PEZI|nr:BTB/POZ domain-containing protein 10 [Elsinoe australis]
MDSHHSRGVERWNAFAASLPTDQGLSQMSSDDASPRDSADARQCDKRAQTTGNANGEDSTGAVKSLRGNNKGADLRDAATQTDGDHEVESLTHKLGGVEGVADAKNHIVFGDLVTIIVRSDNDETRYNIHKTILTRESEYFRTALKSSWLEGQANVVVLDDIEPEVFAHSVHWMYNNTKLTLHPTAYSLPDIQPSLCAKLYVLADRLGVSNLMPCIVDKLWVRRNDPNMLNDIDLATVVNNLPDNSKFLDFLVHWAAINSGANRGSQLGRYIGLNFVQRVLDTFFEHRHHLSWERLTHYRGECHYHEHPLLERCPTGHPFRRTLDD